MPRLGDEAGPGDHQPIANAYSAPSQQLSLGKLVMILVIVFTLRNILFHDYRSEEVDLLKASGQTDDQIDALFVPRTASERRKKQIEEAKDREKEFIQMKKDVDTLKGEVKLLRGVLGEEKLERLGETTSSKSSQKESR